MQTTKQKEIFVRNALNYNTDEVSENTGLKCEDPSLTLQSPKDETDINVIVERFGLTGQLPPDIATPQYGDFTNIPDFHAAMNAVAQAREMFGRLPAVLRAKFNNDPETYVNFCTDEKNIRELKKLGLLNKEALERLNKEDTAAEEKAFLEKQKALFEKEPTKQTVAPEKGTT
uniref:Scaffold protein n=1 Tax=Microviridae sp. ctkQD1 TaxID=2827648 RepID=A0A8S5S507_9VIRU|nr:MAG TPA: Scaffold protein [Microviridae sp. ctkQD1]